MARAISTVVLSTVTMRLPLPSAKCSILMIMRLTWRVADRAKRFFFMSASASIDRIFIIEIAAEDDLTGYEGMTQRQWYAEDLKLRAPVQRNMAIVKAFAAVARERFFGVGPWRILTEQLHGYFQTSDDDPRWIYH